uniref:28S ribosomal protein S10, mitochondrial-like n=1 Tax=Styela clava TaxID=7725 RepID=UPI001939544E|nr:28S ribosomal protein S10, mitochondrial-like [Styela clava]
MASRNLITRISGLQTTLNKSQARILITRRCTTSCMKRSDDRLLPSLNSNKIERTICIRKVHGYGSPEIIETDEPDVLYRGIDVFIKSHEDSVLQSYTDFAVMAANELGIKVTGILHPKMIVDRITLLKSVHVHKKHRAQYEAQTHKRVIQLQHLTGSTADVFLSYIQINIPAGVAMQVHKYAIESLPKHLEKTMEEKYDKITPEDEALAKKMSERMRHSKLSENRKFEEYDVTKPYLIGTAG